MKEVRLSIIAAMSMPGRIIGRSNGDLPWPKIPADFKRFKQVTMGHPLIMGRKTWEDISRRTGGLGLSGRDHIVISKNGLNMDTVVDPCHTFCAYNIENALHLARKVGGKHNDEIFIIGGGEMYQQTIEMVDRMYLTLIQNQFEGEISFPKYTHLFDDPKEINTLRHKNISFKFLEFKRKGLKS
jgi:dihydrofolate reductase